MLSVPFTHEDKRKLDDVYEAFQQAKKEREAQNSDDAKKPESQSPFSRSPRF